MDDVSRVAAGNRLKAHHAGLSTFCLRSNKRPAGEWRKYMTDLPDEADVVAEAERTQGYAIVCGKVSGNLIVFDFENGFGRKNWQELLRRLEAAGLFDNFSAWMTGYTVRTPSGGLHVAVHVMGDDPLPGNTKLAMVDGKVIAETRAEGGYVVGPGSNGDTHPNGGMWDWHEGSHDAIAWDLMGVVEAVGKIVSSFGDEAPPALSPEPPKTKGPDPTFLGGSWIDEAKTQLPSIERVLEDLGWVPARSSDSYGQHWVRPNKDPREGHSASLSHNGYLYVHSTNAGLPTGLPSLDVIDILMASSLGRRPSLDERTAWLRARRPNRPGGEAAGRTAQAMGPVTPSLYLDDEFWQSRTWTAALRDAALARMLSPDAVLGAFLSAYATTIPMGIWVPAVVGARAPLNLYCTIVAVSGGGKTAAMTVASDLLGPVANPDVRLGNSLRSGEGLITLVLKPAKKRRGEEEQFEPSFNAGVQVHFDEGGTLGKQSERAGSTTIPYLNTAWAGAGTVGGAKASDSAGFPANAVRICCVMGVQYGAAANLFTGEAERLGFPQRLLYFGNDNPILASIDVDTMDESPLQPLDLPRYQHSEFTRHPQEMGVPLAIKREVRRWTLDKTVNGLSNPLDGHRMNLRLRIASLFALMEGEFHITEADWDLALRLEKASRSIRSRLLQSLGNVPIEAARQRGRLDAVRLEAQHDVWMEKRAGRIQSRLALNDEGLSKKECGQLLRSDERKQVLVILEYGITRGWIIHRNDRYYAK